MNAKQFRAMQKSMDTLTDEAAVPYGWKVHKGNTPAKKGWRDRNEFGGTYTLRPFRSDGATKYNRAAVFHARGQTESPVKRGQVIAEGREVCSILSPRKTGGGWDRVGYGSIKVMT